MSNPMCPYCGEQMEYYWDNNPMNPEGWYFCPKCHSQAPTAKTDEAAYAAATKRPRAKGEWITRADKWGNSWYYCSECGHEMFFTGTFDREQRFCYYCGADMRKEVNDEMEAH